MMKVEALTTTPHRLLLNTAREFLCGFIRFNISITDARRLLKISGPKKRKFRSDCLAITKVTILPRFAIRSEVQCGGGC